jgi:hypothetical protein
MKKVLKTYLILLAKEENKKNIIEREKKAVQRILYVFCRH